MSSLYLYVLPRRVPRIQDQCPVFLTNLEGKVGKVGKEGRLRE